MSTYKKLNKQDAFITTYSAHKSWALSGSQFSSYGITTLIAGNGYILPNLQQLYYRTKNTDGTLPSHSFDNYNQTTLFYSSSRTLTTGSTVISIPRQIYGTAVKPGTFSLSIPSTAVSVILPVLKGYAVDDYVLDTPTTYLTAGDGTTQTLKPAPGTGGTTVNTNYTFLDDAEGNLYLSGSSVNLKVGDIIYPHGMAVITNPNYWPLVNGEFATPLALPQVTMSFQNIQPIFTHNYHCKVRESEYNFTYNPTALSSSMKTVYDNNGNLYSISSSLNNGMLNNNITSSYFQPYITTVGLYNDANQLIAVGKMTRPVPKSANTEMTIIVKIDI